MLWVCWLIFDGAWAQTKINLETTSAVMEVSMAWFYASGIAFALLGAPVLLLMLVRLLSGRMSDDELIGVRENEDMPHGNPQP